jgi:hypothetical protein
MTPKEKAQELFDKYYIICQEFTQEIQCSIQAKQCALIAVDEIVKKQISGVEFFYYWDQVKYELEKL